MLCKAAPGENCQTFFIPPALFQIGGGRCCVVYKAVAVRDGSVVALKCFRQGSNYDGAIQRESFILDTYSKAGNNIVSCHATIKYRGYSLFVLELLQDNIRQVRLDISHTAL